ncbi:MAG TPA: heme-binding protein [Rubrivivax sp.]|nr:heme-binding protein [Rubrivivax sp.]
MSSLTLQQAHTLINAAFAEARTQGCKPMGVVVVDGAGQVKAAAREDGATALRIDIANGKASAALGMGVSSRVLAQRAKELPAFLTALASVSSQKFLPQTGAVLIKNAAGEVIGAAGASGGTGDEDEAICIAGIAAAGLSHG